MTAREAKVEVRRGRLVVRDVTVPDTVTPAKRRKLVRDVKVAVEYLTTPVEIGTLAHRYSAAKGRKVSHQWVSQMLNSGVRYLERNAGLVIPS